METRQLIAELGTQVSDILRTEGKLAAQTAVNDPTRRAEAEAALRAEGIIPTGEAISQRAYELAQREYGTGSRAQQLTQAITAAMQGALSGDIGSALGGAAAPYVAEYVKTHTDAGAERIISHAVAGAVLAELQQGNALAGATGAGFAAGGAEYLANQLYPGKSPSSLSEAEKQTVAALTTLAASIAGGDLAAAVDGGKAGRNEVENNLFNQGMQSVINAQGSLWTNTDNQMDGNGKQIKSLTYEEKKALSKKIATGDLPEGANIAKAIVDGYEDGVLIAGATYLGPATSISKMIAGGLIAEGANGYFQWGSLNQPGNESGSWNYKSSAAAFAGGMLAPGRGIAANIGINMGGAWFSDGLDLNSQSGAFWGSVASSAFVKFISLGIDEVIGKELPGIAYDMGGACYFEYTNEVVKDVLNGTGDK
ncbi:VENN motif pre-toxin domain-containing protein [Nissabacter sp. SGAir0207]|uniref:VENN motif pre-toxin domain-containing protein n=1 Tax=Nissabacter sp. SGAir0207 TaxID=2126321 RepID=UPI00143D695E|nr:VENN motif pre-toxin domain-containing protein [Nissabacter sp. SGAir0207]